MGYWNRKWPRTWELVLTCGLIGFYLLCIAQAHAQVLPAPDQPLPSFEVASVRPSSSVSQGMNLQVAPLRFRAGNATLAALIRFAYDVRSDDQLEKGPRWTSTERFDIDAKIDDAQADATKRLSPEQQINLYRLMLQSLLKDRFALRVSTQMKQLDVYALVVAKSGPKMASAEMLPDPKSQPLPTLVGWSRGEVTAKAVTMSMLSEQLSGNLDIGGRVVIDATGLSGSYNFTLHWIPFSKQSAASIAPASKRVPDATEPDATGIPLMTALEEQLGLKLVPRRAPVRVLVIDHVEHPSAN